MDLKKKKKYLNKCLRILKGKNSYKITSFTDLAKAIKISLKTFRFYELNESVEIKEMLKNNRHENSLQKSVKKGKKVPQKNVKKIAKVPLKNVEEKRVRSYEELNAKLFGYKAYKTKNYSKLKESAKRLLDRQIWILEWVLLQDKKTEEGKTDVRSDNIGE